MRDEIAEKEQVESHEELLEKAERAVDVAFATGKADRAQITLAARQEADAAIEMVDAAIIADEEADEASRISVIASESGNRDRAKEARKKEREARKKAKAEHRAATKSARRAYEAVKFSAPNKMGFMRTVQVIFGIHIFTVVLYLMLTSRDTMTYTTTTWIDWLMVVLESVAFWMFLNRYKVGRPFVIGMAIAGLVLPAAVDISAGTFNPFALAINGAFYVFLIFYFALSKRVKATLVNDVSKTKGEYDSEEFKINRRGWPFWRNLIIYFLVFSNVGHWMEMAMCQLIIMGVVQGDYDPTNTMLWRDWLFPFAMEGFAVVFIALFLYPLLEWLKKKINNRILPYVISFFTNALFCTLVEFAGGMLVNADHQLWDYSDQFCNFMGQVCLQNSLAFGVAASLIAWFVYPMLERWIARIPRDIMNIAFVAIVTLGVLIWSLYILPGFNEPAPSAQSVASQSLTGDRLALDVVAKSSQENIDSLQALVDKSKELSDEERAAIEERLKSIKSDYEEISTLVNAGASSGSAAAASSGDATIASSGSAASASAESAAA